jgi:hypothetical protein
MRRLLLLALLAGAAWWLLGHRRRHEPHAVVGYADGSSITLGSESPELARLVAAARTVVGS